MSYKPTHAKPSALVKAATRGGVIAGAAAIAAASAGALAPGAASAAVATAAPLGVTLGTQVNDDGSSATWSSAGQIDLTLGSPSSTTGAYATITPASTAITPSTPEPTFTTDNYSAGSPRWVIELSNGASLWGYPPNSGLNGSDFGWVANNGNSYTSWADALASAGVTANTTVTATSVQIVADGDQADGTIDQITNVSYNGQTVGGGTVTLGTEATQQATVGSAFSTTDAATTTSSDTQLTYSASGLPAGVTINPSTGTISGTPTTAGQYAVTVHAADVYGDSSNYQHFVLDVAAAPTYTATGGSNGKVQNAGSGKYLNVSANTYAPGAGLIQWDATGASHETFQYVTIKNSAGTVTGGYLQAESPNGTWYYVTASGEGQLTLGSEVAHPTSAVLAGVLASNEDVERSGNYYEFVNDSARVADDSGQSLANGAHIIAYTKDGGKNQQWSLP